MATKSISSEQNNINSQYQCAYTEAKRFFTCAGIRKPQSFPHIKRQKNNKQQSNIHEVTMYILHDQRKGIFTTILFARLRNRAGRRICPKGFIISPAVIIAG